MSLIIVPGTVCSRFLFVNLWCTKANRTTDTTSTEFCSNLFVFVPHLYVDSLCLFMPTGLDYAKCATYFLRAMWDQISNNNKESYSSIGPRTRKSLIRPIDSLFGQVQEICLDESELVFGDPEQKRPHKKEQNAGRLEIRNTPGSHWMVSGWSILGHTIYADWPLCVTIFPSCEKGGGALCKLRSRLLVAVGGRVRFGC